MGIQPGLTGIYPSCRQFGYNPLNPSVKTCYSCRTGTMYNIIIFSFSMANQLPEILPGLCHALFMLRDNHSAKIGWYWHHEYQFSPRRRRLIVTDPNLNPAPYQSSLEVSGCHLKLILFSVCALQNPQEFNRDPWEWGKMNIQWSLLDNKENGCHNHLWPFLTLFRIQGCPL